MKITEQTANIIYNILVEHGQANENDRAMFVFHHCKEQPCEEWNFGGLAAGAKYRSQHNYVDVYPEFETDEIRKKLNKLNIELSYLPYIKVLQDFGYTKQNCGYFRMGEFSKNWVTLFEGNKLQMYQYEIDDDNIFEDGKIYDTNVIIASPEELRQLIQILVINQIKK